MIQRIQTVYLLLCFILTVLCVYFEIGDESHSWALTAIMAFTGVLEFLGIFLFRRRALQMRLCTFCIILLVGWYLALVAFSYILGEGLVGDYRPKMWASIPFVNIVLLYLAFRGILHDEILVKSLDRLR
jgi:peptidoglycan/LPS O-acetylase OafA/YrhL